MRPNSRPYTLGDDQDANLVGMRLYGTGPFHRELKPAMQIAKKSHFVIRAGDVIYNKLFAWKGTFGIVPQDLDGMYVSDKFPTYELNRARVDEGYLRWFFRHPDVWEQARVMSTGSAALSKLTLNPPKFLDLEIPLPPLDEQSRIVARIEELAAKVAEARGLRGRSAEDRPLLVDAFLRERFARFARHYSPTNLDQVLVDAAYGTSEKSYAERPKDAVPVLRIPNVASEKLQLGDLKYAQLTPSAVESLALKDGDILIVRTNGSIDLVGRSAVVNGLPEASVYASYLIRLRFDESTLTPDFAQIGLRHLRRSGALVDLARTTAGQYNVSLGRLRGATLPIPPLPVQRQTVAELEALQATVDAVRVLQNNTAAQLDSMIPAILDRAFKGEL